MPDIAKISPVELKLALDDGRCTVCDLRASANFRKGHIPRSRWSIRPRLVEAVRDNKGWAVILIADDYDVARVGAIDLIEAGCADVKALDGGIEAWTQAGYAVETNADRPPDPERIDHLFFVHDRHVGNREAMRQYLAWETGLIAQLDAQDRAAFKVGAALGHK